MRNIFVLSCVILISVLSSTDCIGQEKEDIDVNLSSLNIPATPSPTPASLGKYSNNTVSGFTGATDISIPLYTLVDDGFELPITLRYNSTGVKVSELASWVGQGFSLDCGGVVTRSVMDVPDDEDFLSQGWLKYNYLVNSNVWDGGKRTLGYSPEHVENNVIGLAEMRRSGIVKDTEPDIFYYNFCGNTGKFVFSQGTIQNNIGQTSIESRWVNQFPLTNLKINFTMGKDPKVFREPQMIASFNIFDSRGNQYIFESRERSFQQSKYNDFIPPSRISNYYDGGSSSSTTHISSWYLSKIITAKKGIIEFKYEEEEYTIEYPDSYSVRNFERVSRNVAKLKIDKSEMYDFYNVSTRRSQTQMKGLRLASIKSSNFTILFEAKESRKDLTGASGLTGIKIYSNNSSLKLEKEIKFGYDYLQSAIDPFYVSANKSPYGDANKRLILSKVWNDVQENVPPYSLEYNNEIKLPNRYSSQQDFWGYFNNNGSKTMTPTVYIYPGEGGSQRFSLFKKSEYGGTEEYEVTGADRNSNAAAIISGSLKKITYPTGGYQEFIFGPHEFFYLGRNIVGGGLRLEKSIVYDGSDHKNDVVREFDYKDSSSPTKSSGRVFNLPVFTYAEAFLPYWNPSNAGQILPTPSGQFDPEYLGYYLYNMVISSAPSYSLSGYDGVNIGYSEIKETYVNNGSVKSTYNVIAPLDASVEEVAEVSNIYRKPELHTYWFHDYCPDGTLINNGEMVDTKGLEFDTDGYPFGPKPNYDIERGQLISREVYDANGTKLTSTQNDYMYYSPKAASQRYVFGLRKGRMSNYKIYVSPCWSTFGLARFDVVLYYPIVTNLAKVIEKSTERQFDSTGKEFAVTTVVYKYSGNQMNPSEVVTSDNLNQTIKEYQYPNDFLGSAVQGNLWKGISNLQRMNIVAPVEINEFSQRLGDNKRYHRKSTYFSYNPNFNLVDSIQEHEKKTANFTKSGVNGAVLFKDPGYKTRQYFSRYDSKMNLLEKIEQDVTVSYLWAYNGQFPVAEIKNAKYSEIEVILTKGVVESLYSPTVSDETINNAINKLRTDTRLSKALITSYTYRPIVGITSMTDARGVTEYYEYDGIQRLKAVLDQVKNVTTSVNYHYRSN